MSYWNVRKTAIRYIDEKIKFVLDLNKSIDCVQNVHQSINEASGKSGRLWTSIATSQSIARTRARTHASSDSQILFAIKAVAQISASPWIFQIPQSALSLLRQGHALAHSHRRGSLRTENARTHLTGTAASADHRLISRLDGERYSRKCMCIFSR